MMAGRRADLEITNDLGIHLRAARQFVELAARFGSEIRVGRDGTTVNGRSILDLLILGAGRGARIAIEARGPDADAALAALAGLVRSGFDERAGPPP